jgi:mono/diheme cytochrome c family protein
MKGSGVLLAVASCFAASLLLPLPASAQPTVKRETARRVASTDGKVIYREYCAVCHGVDGKGNGPAAQALNTPPPDLTTYAQRQEGRFSEMDLRTVIEGEKNVAAHGSKEMPIWGNIFRVLTGGDPQERDLRMRNLIEHIRSMQVK